MTEIKPAYEHSRIGQLFFNITTKATKLLSKQRWLYYLLHFTWGIVMTIIAGLVAGILAFVNLFTKNMTFTPYHGVLEIGLGQNWGGCDLGLVYLRDTTSNVSVSNHELGHSFQVWLGIFFPFVVAIPSAIRWWIRRLQPNKEHKPYSSIWFEDSADQVGRYVTEYFESGSNDEEESNT